MHTLYETAKLDISVFVDDIYKPVMLNCVGVKYINKNIRKQEKYDFKIIIIASKNCPQFYRKFLLQ